MSTLPASFLSEVARRAERANVFESVREEGKAVRCKARDSAADAWYVVAADGERWMVRLETPDRWLSESIEADLMHYGDPMEELIEEELIELGHDEKRDGAMPSVRHFRSDEKLYTFECDLPIGTAASAQPSERAVEIASRYLLAFEAAFRELGDMSGSDDEE